MKETVLVLGSGPIRIGQGIEFDYSCVHCVWALREMGFRAIIVNNNPETVSTDFDTGDGLYFEPVTLTDVQRILRHEKPLGVVVQFGGQTAINLAGSLSRFGVNILGTSAAAIAAAEDRDQFERLLTQLGISKPAGRAVRSLAEATEVASEIGYPVLVRPSFVLGGRAMEIVYEPDQLAAFYALAEEANPGQPVLVDKYIVGKEAEVDVISDGVDTLVPGIMEHIERAGVHSGDSMAVYPPVTLSRDEEWRMVEIACGIARELGVKGLMNIQFVLDDAGEVHVLEVNPRASRTVPYLSKVSGIPMVQLATRCMMGETLADNGYTSGLWCVSDDQPPREKSVSRSDCGPRAAGVVADREQYLGGTVRQNHLFAVKAPVFSFQKLTRVEPSLGPEMKSTGEVLGVDSRYEAALFKAMLASGITFKGAGKVAITLNPLDKPHAVRLGKAFLDAGYELVCTEGTAAALAAEGLPTEVAKKLQEGSPNFLEMILRGELALMINTPGLGAASSGEGQRIRRACLESGVACITSIDTALALTEALPLFRDPDQADCRPYTAYLRA